MHILVTPPVREARVGSVDSILLEVLDFMREADLLGARDAERLGAADPERVIIPDWLGAMLVLPDLLPW